MAFTGGPLNLLNGRKKIFASKRSVDMLKLIREQQPVSWRELKELIPFLTHHI